MTDDHEFRASERRRQRAIDSTENERRAHRNAQRSRQRALHRRRRLTALGVLALGIAGASGAWIMRGSPPGNASTAPVSSATETTAPGAIPAHVAMPASVRGVHLSGPWMSLPGKYEQTLSLARGDSGLNSVQIDLKDERGEVSFTKGAPAMAKAIGATRGYVDLRAATRLAHERGVYVIGRVVCFQDPILAAKRPELAVRNASGGTWSDPEGKQWVNQYDAAVGSYLISIGKAALALGVDEIQFDYIRFPTYAGGVWPHKRNEPKSVTINAFLDRARAAFKPAKLAVSVFGVAAVHPLDGAAIGQVIPQMMKHVDVISPMIYPRLYNPGEFDLPVPRSEPGTVVARTLGYYKSDLLGSSVKLRPWLQDYDGYGYDQVAAQVHAADRAGVDGWLLWDAGVDYQTRALNIDR